VLRKLEPVGPIVAIVPDEADDCRSALRDIDWQMPRLAEPTCGRYSGVRRARAPSALESAHRDRLTSPECTQSGRASIGDAHELTNELQDPLKVVG
jgi:hypothetical protein